LAHPSVIRPEGERKNETSRRIGREEAACWLEEEKISILIIAHLFFIFKRDATEVILS
jgi:hypothetical protein